MIESIKTKVESIYDLSKLLNKGLAKDIEVVHDKTGESYTIAYQFYWGHQRKLAYLAFISKDTHEIDFIDEDIDKDRFEEISEDWMIFVGG